MLEYATLDGLSAHESAMTSWTRRRSRSDWSSTNPIEQHCDRPTKARLLRRELRTGAPLNFA